MATACIPWDKEFEFCEDIFRIQIRNLLDNNIKSIYLFGTAGEGYAVNDRQFLQIIKTFKSETRNIDSMPMIGLISTSLAQIIDRINMSLKLGFNDFQISFPSWGKLNTEESIAFFDAILPKYHDCRFMHYNNGQRSRLLLKIEDYIQLSEKYENLVAVKYPGLVNIDDIHKISASKIPIQFFPLEFGYGAMRPLGECGIILSYLNMNYTIAHKYFNAGIKNDIKTINNIHNNLIIVKDIFKKTLPNNKIDGAYDKVFVKMMISDFPLRLYPPYKGLAMHEYDDFVNNIKSQLPEWFE